LARCPGIALLATSREPLRLPGERVVPVGPLLPDSSGRWTQASELFLARVAGQLPSFELAAGDEDVVDDICRSLEGLPLALELAAAWVPVLGLPDLRDSVVQGFELSAKRRGESPRHQSLRAAVEWSYALLSSDERGVFERLSVFAGSFELAAAKAVCGPVSGRMADHVASLVDKSLLVHLDGATPSRYRQLEPVRQFAAERLAARAEDEHVAQRHLAHYVEWVALADAGVRGRDELRWHHAFEAEWHNLRKAVARAIATDDADAACQLIWHVRWWAAQRLRFEGREWADAVAALPSARDHPLRPIVLATVCAFARCQGDWHAVAASLEEARRHEQRLGNAIEPWVPYEEWFVADRPSRRAEAAHELRERANGDVFWVVLATKTEVSQAAATLVAEELDSGESSRLIALLRASAALAERSESPSAVGRGLGDLGCGLRRSDPVQALALMERALAIARSVGNDQLVAGTFMDLGPHLAEISRPVEALQRLGSQIRQFVRAGAWELAHWACVAAVPALLRLGRPDVACALAGRVRRSMSHDEVWANYVYGPATFDSLRTALGQDQVECLVAEALPLTYHQVVVRVLGAIDEIERLVA
jgi:predicted ATPase